MAIVPLGICCEIEKGQAAIDAGFDFVELPLASLTPASSVRFPAEATNLFFPSGVLLYGVGAFDWRSYATRQLAIANRIGIKVAVIGSGAQRRSLPWQSLAEAEHEFIDIVARIQEIATTYGIMVAPEALNRSETDVFNTASHLAHSLNQRGLRYTFDTHHVQLEPSANDFDLLPVHVHFAGEGRGIPGFDDPVWASCIEPLLQRGYSGRFSLESNAADFGPALARAQRKIREKFAAL